MENEIVSARTTTPTRTSRGSVAERVMLFEKCPEVREPSKIIKKIVDKPFIKSKLHAEPQNVVQCSVIMRDVSYSARGKYIPRFYFPHGVSSPTIATEKTIRLILAAFDTFPNNQLGIHELPGLLKICDLPFYWRMPILQCTEHRQSGLVERQAFVDFWKKMTVYCHDSASKFVFILSRGQRNRQYILPEDLESLVQDVVDTHPGLAFLRQATEFHSKYVTTVISRIFYSVNRNWSGKITPMELRNSDLLEIIKLLEVEEDINQIMAFFSYEHFYVIYCKFWELDTDHDFHLKKRDLARYSDHALSSRIIERIFSECLLHCTRSMKHMVNKKMSYKDFVWFILSEEDKRTPTAIEYWFHCMDVDGDGLLSMYELEYFYEEQQQRMDSIGIEILPFVDCLCQMLDMIKPKQPGYISLGDLKRCKLTNVFFDTFLNLEKFLQHEQRDPLSADRDDYISDWDRFAAEEYENLIAEDNRY
ncbi:serine/threonine-protein phosphatase 2A regulatory subunit B'' subunit beta isoform X2 [Episyrphus balteatus]|uniref:serine/threonine-protein phosphatase 2A regulatory subunit B'' subunit beta isoform X2 n=1 Tax=Episyrphus balteatus TaxID=286459 RepID=UPI002484F1AD|nr:serine/threonine-protein phosphatase 2A regulatory subunit B'' subunit beta isoform X2 [Episyrphus balteatus]